MCLIWRRCADKSRNEGETDESAIKGGCAAGSTRNGLRPRSSQQQGIYREIRGKQGARKRAPMRFCRDFKRFLACIAALRIREFRVRFQGKTGGSDRRFRGFCLQKRTDPETAFLVRAPLATAILVA